MMDNDVIIKTYVKAIKEGKLTIDDVDDEFREQVKALLD